MNRLLVTAGGDLRLQLRQGFYYAAAFVLVALLALVRSLPRDELPWILPLAVFGNVQVNTFYFLAGLVLLERTEGTLEVQVVTPLRVWEYLGAKVATLTLLSLVENVGLVLIGYGADVDLAALVVGIVATSVPFCLAGFLTVARYESINEFLVPSSFLVAVLSAPLLPYFGVWETPWMAAHPLQPGLTLTRAAFEGADSAVWTRAIGVATAWCVLGWLACCRAHRRFVVARAGSRRP